MRPLHYVFTMYNKYIVNMGVNEYIVQMRCKEYMFLTRCFSLVRVALCVCASVCDARYFALLVSHLCE